MMDEIHEARSSSKGICEKIRRSLAGNPGKQSFNQVSYVQQENISPASAASKNMFEPKHVFKAGVVPIEFDRSAFAKGKQGNSHIGIEIKAKSEPNHNHHWNEDQKVETKMNDKFSEFIKHAKMKISRTSSNAGALGIARMDTVNKKATAYIDRARQRIKNSATFRP